MVRKGLAPDGFTYGILIDGFCKQKRSGEAKLMLKEMCDRHVSPDQVGEMEKATALLNEMIAMGIDPDTLTYNYLIEGYCRGHNMVKAYELLADMKGRNLAPTVYTCGVIIKWPYVVVEILNGLIWPKRWKTARNYLAEMIARGLKPNVYTYGALIHGYIKAGEMQAADRYFQEMLGCGIAPNDVIYTKLIDGHCKEGNIKEAFSTFRCMLGRGVIPDEKTYSVLIHGNRDKAATLLENMVWFRWVPDSTVITDFVKEDQNATNSENAVNFLKQAAIGRRHEKDDSGLLAGDDRGIE
ncbi:hypothetical protein Patl1_01310 [Pistacia atlantica]|uniref:Uncharacterized protein n=1 Tax=Pistacia atlantica TaxID=434234 RepID=A0ACC1C731_9ROSI|nr:hypothetical protein Patl1_01310 [Pistacia atlantica]